MLRTPIVVIVLLAAGCNGDDTQATCTTNCDAAVVDTGPQILKCSELVTCLNSCDPTDPRDMSCQSKCFALASGPAQALLRAAVQCAVRACGPGDGGLGRCANQQDTSMDCNVCFGNAIAGGATGLSCMPGDDPACADCATEFSTCLNDM
jgi:hypothetical protein